MKDVIGSPEDIALFQNRLDTVYRQRDYYVVGSVGWHAIEASLGWHLREQPLPLRYQVKGEARERTRDIDILSPRRGEQGAPRLGPPFRLDFTVNIFIATGRQPGKYDYEIGRRIVFGPELLQPRERQFAGRRVRTFWAGNQFMIQLLMSPGEREKYARARRQRSGFIQWARKHHPEEFLDDEAYEPYIAFGRAIGRNMDLFTG